jgi:F-box protein 9
MDRKPTLPSIDESSPAVPKQDQKEEDGQAQELDSSPLWEYDGWELTWPIWHMLPRDERKLLAQRHGYNTIGEFEEYMSLQRAVGDSEETKPYANKLAYPLNSLDPTALSEKNDTTEKEQVDDDDDEDSVSDENRDFDRQTSACTEDLSLDELMEAGGKILMLHEDLLHQVFSWLPVDAYGTLALVSNSPHWKNLTRIESVYKRLCERLYLNQSKRRQLHVSRFGNSYRNMLKNRPRVRAAGGCYVLKYYQIKPIQRDMWCEVRHWLCIAFPVRCL